MTNLVIFMEISKSLEVTPLSIVIPSKYTFQGIKGQQKSLQDSNLMVTFNFL